MAREELDGVHVMVVEDNDDSRDMLQVALEYCGALVTTAATVEEALRVLGTLRPHVLVTDISMPDDGLQLIREVMASARAQGIDGIPVIAVTAHRGRRQELLAEGFVELVEKPLNPIAACGVIGRHARRRRGHEEEHEQESSP